VCEATRTLKELIKLNEKWISSITTDEEAGLIPKCLATLNDWKVATSEMMKKTVSDLVDKVSKQEALQLKQNVKTELERINNKKE
jgi:hypothetical protein